MKWLERCWYEVRWWRWFLFDGWWPVQSLYCGKWKLDKQSRRIIIGRRMREWESREPKFRGKLIHHQEVYGSKE